MLISALNLADAPLALVGYSPAAARALQPLGLTALSVPAEQPASVIQACQTLRFGGALIAPAFQAAWFEAAQSGAIQADTEARRVGKVDTLTFGMAGVSGTFAHADALKDALEAHGYSALGASLAVVGQTAADMAVAAPLSRLGFTDIGLVANSAPEAERAIRDLPTGLRIFPMSRRDGSLQSLLGRTDLVVLTAGELPSGLLEPYHTVLDLTGKLKTPTNGANVLALDDLDAYRLARSLEHATGQKFALERLKAVAAQIKE